MILKLKGFKLHSPKKREYFSLEDLSQNLTDQFSHATIVSKLSGYDSPVISDFPRQHDQQSQIDESVHLQHSKNQGLLSQVGQSHDPGERAIT